MKITLFIILSAILLSTFAFTANKYFTIKEITCKNQYGPCDQRLSTRLKDLEGRNYLSMRSLIEDTISQEPSVKGYSTQLKLPDNLEVSVVRQKAKFALKTHNEVYILVSDEWKILEMVNSSSLPYIVVDSFSGSVGDKVSSEQLFALKLIESLFFSYSISEGKLDQEMIEVRLKNRIKVLFPRQGDVQVLLGSLELINSRLKEEGKDSKIDKVQEISQIDLRYDNPVIK